MKRALHLLLAATPLVLLSCDSGTGPVEPVPTTVTVAPTAVALTALGASDRLTALVLDQDGRAMAGVGVTWASDDEAVATVDPSGAITATGNGSTTVHATTGTISGSASITVSQEAATLFVADSSITLRDPGDSHSLMAEALDALGSELDPGQLTWSTSDAAVVTVDSAGVVTAVSEGSAEVTASIGTLAAIVSVRVAPELTVLPVGSGAVSGTVATTVALSARVESLAGAPWDGAEVLWSTGAGSGAIVSTQVVESDETGHVGAVWELGTTAGTQRAFVQIDTRGQTVVVEFVAAAEAAEAVTASMVADTVLLSAIGETAFFAPAFADEWGNVAEASSLTWTSRDESIATVAADGLVTGAGVGSVWIVASMGSPVDSVEVTVEERGAITITFDDGWRTVYDNAVPVMEEFGLVGNIGVYTEVVGAPAYMTEAHLDELHAAGWSMPSHTVSHDSLPTLTPGELDFELQASKAWLDARGYRGTNVLIAPYHEFEERERIAASTYYTAARGEAAFTDSLTTWRPDNPYRLAGFDAELLPFTTSAGRDVLRTLLQKAVDEGSFVDVYFHHMPVANVDAFRATLAVLDDFRDRVLPYHELYPLFARTVF